MDKCHGSEIDNESLCTYYFNKYIDKHYVFKVLAEKIISLTNANESFRIEIIKEAVDTRDLYLNYK